jgi:hypothetical protein
VYLKFFIYRELSLIQPSYDREVMLYIWDIAFKLLIYFIFEHNSVYNSRVFPYIAYYFSSSLIWLLADSYWRAGHNSYVLDSCYRSVWFTTRPETSYPKTFRGFPQSLPVNSRIIPRLDHDRLLPNSFNSVLIYHPTIRWYIVHRKVNGNIAQALN